MRDHQMIGVLFEIMKEERGNQIYLIKEAGIVMGCFLEIATKKGHYFIEN
jgi:hypothetical protein